MATEGESAILLPLFYLPPVSWCTAAWNSSNVMIEACENYQKGSMRNRCHIAGPNGVQRLSIPLVKGKHRQTPVRDVRIAYDEPWQQQHWRSIRTAYGNAPFFEHYAGEILRFYERRYAFLFDYNLDLLIFILQKKSGWQGNLMLTPSWQAAGKWPQLQDERDADWGEPGVWPHRCRLVRYPQVFEERHGFLSNLSVLDMLFCCGKKTGDMLAASPPSDGV